MPLKIRDDLALGPAAVVTIGLCQESAVATVVGFNQSYAGVAKYSGPCFGKQADEGIIFGVDDERRHCNMVHYTGGRCAAIVIVSACESTIVGGNPLIKFANTARPTDLALIYLGKESCLSLISTHQAEEEFPFVDTIPAFMHGIRRRSEVGSR